MRRFLIGLSAAGGMLACATIPGPQPKPEPAPTAVEEATEPPPSRTARPQPEPRSRNVGGSCDTEPQPLPDDPSTLEVIHPKRPIPDFHVTTVDCARVSSDELVGKRPFVLVFFSSWCAVCEKKMPVVTAAAEELGDDVTFLGVALDDDDSWADVGPFIERYDLTFPVIRGAHHQSFALGYNPMQSIPVIVVVGRNGYVVDLQIGYSPFDYNRLVGAVEVAKRTEGPSHDER